MTFYASPYSSLIKRVKAAASENWHHKLEDFILLTLETLKEQITDKLQGCFNVYCNTPPGVNWKGQGFTMKQIAYNLHGDTNSIEFLHSLYADLVSQGKGCIANTSFSEVDSNPQHRGS
uniref:Uncharacterized protein orf118-b n=1 Tax=Zea mays subsp. mays TaxID=381124 RepID=Q1KK88_MAIZE|nr:hypothetical protein [Zea mays subsp. mays]